jgi:hypothetical protein
MIDLKLFKGTVSAVEIMTWSRMERERYPIHDWELITYIF